MERVIGKREAGTGERNSGGKEKENEKSTAGRDRGDSAMGPGFAKSVEYPSR